VDLPSREVRVLASEGTPTLVLKTPHDLPEADHRDFLELDERLFPGGERHRYYLLVILNESDGEAVFGLRTGSLVLTDDKGRTFSPVDLGPVVRERAGALPPYLLPQLKLWLASDADVTLPPGSRRTVLLAYPEAARPEVLVRGRHGDVELLPRSLVKDRLDADLDAPDAVLRAKRP
jgi:hypothetical protein